MHVSLGANEIRLFSEKLQTNFDKNITIVYILYLKYKNKNYKYVSSWLLTYNVSLLVETE